MSTDTIARHRRLLNGIPSQPDLSAPLPKRILTNPWTWIGVVLTGIYAACLWSQYALMTADTPVRGGVVPGINHSAIRDSFWFAMPTLLFWIVLFVIADRFRPQRLLVWYLTLGWGAAVATFLSLHINTWASEQLSIVAEGTQADPTTGARAAIYIAPFVEEAAKATVLFGVALLARYQLVTKLNGVALAGLSAAGFAFTENIIYYSRAIMYSTSQINTGDAESAIHELVWLRGFWTAFGHPLFTMMTGLGLMVALRTHSKVVRVLAPLIGYLMAALLHMMFNSQATFAQGMMRYIIYFAVALPLVASATIYAVRQLFTESRKIRARLTDYVRMGWLNPVDPDVTSRVRHRAWALMVAATRGWTVLRATLSLQRTLTELAYLRDAEVKGVIDTAGQARATELLYQTRSLRGLAIDDPRGQKLSLPTLRKRQPVDYPPPSYPGPAGLGGNWPAGPGAAPLGSQQYSRVDPNWGPPPG
ncbi:PrsW family intramembrane metalloprotease [Micropruina sp.]|uniref:PrsW family intramembrane metalloprotease n=1 Tax=Micropruina sp. TaxID=2737536 RepID=UPI0039E32C46